MESCTFNFKSEWALPVSCSGRNCPIVSSGVKSPLRNYDLDLRKKTGCAIIGYKDENGDYIVNPGEDLEVAPNSKIIVLGRPEQIEALNLEYNIL